ncbi:MAG: LytTR family DNA-binding domain-containing protein [Candidatus Limisoma sp.]|nr:LytTR family transcriptional regulator [Muribaculaceae bacterium]MDY5999914.1 LytTR family DNA-binding domain-containing protein [Candidatus Limisoma sp.]
MAKCLIFSNSGELLRVPCDSVVYISADGNYSTLILANGSKHTVTLQLGQIEQKLSTTVGDGDNRFIRIGKSLIVNKDYIAYINPTKQKLVLSDYSTFRHEVNPSRESLKALKEYLEKEESL